jgi:oligopeptide transport system ATP-binding protein
VTTAETTPAPAEPSSDGEVLLSVSGLQKYFPIRRGVILQRRVGAVQAVDGLSFSVRKGETLALVGESGCGKTTTAQSILRLVEPESGSIRFDGQDITHLGGSALRPFRRRMQIIFQDPYASLDPRTPIADSIGEGLRIHGVGNGRERREKVRRMMDLVGLQSFHARRYPHEFSGGQRQRIGIARALVLEPDLLVCDEPVSALDVSIQAQVLNLLKDLQSELGLTYLFIAHNMGVVEHICDRVAVMYLGRVAEIAERRELFRDAQHPYTQALLSAIPVPDPELRRKRIILKGDVPSPVNPPSGCRFHPRCPLRAELGNPEICATAEPALLVVPGERHAIACHFRGEGVEVSRATRTGAATTAGAGTAVGAQAAAGTAGTAGTGTRGTPSEPGAGAAST